MEAVERTVLSNDWITGILLLSLLCMVFAKEMFYNRFLNFIILPFNNKYIFLYNKKGRLLTGFHLAFSLFQILNLSLFAYLGAQAWEQEARWGSAFVFPVILGGLLGFILLKTGMQLTAGYLFDQENLISSLIFKKISYLNYSTLVLFGANLLLTYLLPQSKAIVLAGFSLALLVNIIGWITILKMNQKYVSTHFFYFILYLCALEIAPIVIISSVLNS